MRLEVAFPQLASFGNAFLEWTPARVLDRSVDHGSSCYPRQAGLSIRARDRDASPGKSPTPHALAARPRIRMRRLEGKVAEKRGSTPSLRVSPFAHGFERQVNVTAVCCLAPKQSAQEQESILRAAFFRPTTAWTEESRLT
ncbi:MAG: hypothetical protein OXN89_11540 [Bryobacterales bacterium]|nr:hypothetical protein [Bryobacterales bacterium]